MKSHTGAVMTKFRDGFRQARAKQYLFGCPGWHGEALANLRLKALRD